MPQPIQTARDQVELLAGFALDNIDGLVLTKLIRVVFGIHERYTREDDQVTGVGRDQLHEVLAIPAAAHGNLGTGLGRQM